MKVKLRDITKEQYSKWVKEKCGSTHCENCFFGKVNCSNSYSDGWVYNKNLYSDEFLNQEIEIEDERILTDEEKKYLENVIRPFKDKVEYIRKGKGAKEFIFIALINEAVVLPYFEDDKYYKGMETNKLYTLEELRLFEEGKLEK